MNVKVWEGTKQYSQFKTPILRLVKDGGYISIDCVDEDGCVIAYFLTITECGVTVKFSAKNALEENGYDTSFTSWDENGAIKVND